MLELGSLGEIFIILIAALILIGPKEMPQILRTLGKWMQKIQTLTASWRHGIDHYIQEGKFEEYQRSVNQEKLRASQNCHPEQAYSEHSDPELFEVKPIPGGLHCARNDEKRVIKDAQLQESPPQYQHKERLPSSPDHEL